MDERVMVFIDGSNLHHAVERRQRKDTSFRIDYQKLVGALVGARKLVRAYYYGSRPMHAVAEQESFFKKLERLGFEISIKTLKVREKICKSCGQAQRTYIEKGVDVALITDLLAFGFRNGYDTAIIVSGDNDFLGAINEVKRLPRRVEIAAFSDSVSEETQRKADAFISLEALEGKIRM
jgi:uncharacterized LabA/DUF88 family protein